MSDPSAPGGRAAVILDWVVFAAFAGGGFLVAFGRGLLGRQDPDPLLSTGLGVLLVVTGHGQVILRRARRDLRRMDDLLTDVRFGAGTRRDRDAVDILVRALRTPDERARETALRTLRRISGMDLGPDPAAWEQWWAAGRSTFVRAGASPEEAAAGRSPPGKM